MERWSKRTRVAKVRERKNFRKREREKVGWEETWVERKQEWMFFRWISPAGQRVCQSLEDKRIILDECLWSKWWRVVRFSLPRLDCFKCWEEALKTNSAWKVDLDHIGCYSWVVQSYWFSSCWILSPPSLSLSALLMSRAGRVGDRVSHAFFLHFSWFIILFDPPLMFEEWRGMKNDETRMRMNERNEGIEREREGCIRWGMDLSSCFICRLRAVDWMHVLQTKFIIYFLLSSSLNSWLSTMNIQVMKEWRL